jgi:hypothetical protein
VATGLLVIIPVGIARTEHDARLPQLLGNHVSPLIAMGFIGVDVVGSPPRWSLPLMAEASTTPRLFVGELY